MPGLLSSRLKETRQKRIVAHLRGDLLDLGCGNGQLLEQFGTQITSYCGVDHNTPLIEKMTAKHPDIPFLVRNLDHEPLGLDAQFDCITMIALIEHLFNQEFVMRGVAQALRPGGNVLLTSPTPFGNDVVHRIGASLGLFSRHAMEDHVVVFNRYRLNLLAREVGLDMSHYETFQFGCNQFAIFSKPT